MKEQKERQTTFKSAVMSIYGNGIDCQDTFIHTRNITQMWIGTIPKKPMPFIPIIIFGVVGLFLIQEKVLLGLISLAIARVIIFLNLKQTEYYGMNIELSSGRIYSFTSSDRSFLT